MSGDDPTTEELRAIQADRADAERAHAEEAETPFGEQTHERRADKAEYLKRRLEEQAASEADER